MYNLNEHIPRIEAAALAAARHILFRQAKPAELQTWRKVDQSLVTNVDVEAQQIIIDLLKEDLPLLCEEDQSSHQLLESASSYYLVDPLDGTSSYKRSLGQPVGQLGFGPLIGLVLDGKLSACCFYNLPWQSLLTAVHSGGAWMWRGNPDSRPPSLQSRTRLKIKDNVSLAEAAMLFYPASAGELSLVGYLRSNGLIDNAYRFGGFANDCCRLACGFEQIQCQSAVKPWDFSAVLLEIEAGLTVTVEPHASRCPFEDWKIKMANPILATTPSLHSVVINYIDQIGTA